MIIIYNIKSREKIVLKYHIKHFKMNHFVILFDLNQIETDNFSSLCMNATITMDYHKPFPYVSHVINSHSKWKLRLMY